MKAKNMKNRYNKIDMVRWDPIIARLEDYKLKFSHLFYLHLYLSTYQFLLLLKKLNHKDYYVSLEFGSFILRNYVNESITINIFHFHKNFLILKISKIEYSLNRNMGLYFLKSKQMLLH